MAASNALTLAELLKAFVLHWPDHQVIERLDYALRPDVRTRLAAWCRLPATCVRSLDLRRVFPAAAGQWFVQDDSPHSLAGLITPVIRAGVCPACLVEQRAAGIPPHLPAEWALGCLTHCRRHHALLLHACVRCFRSDALDFSLSSVGHGPRCGFCGSPLPVLLAGDHEPWAFVLRLQHTLVAALGGRRPSRQWVGPCTARSFVDMVDDLVNVVTGRDSHSGLVLADLLPSAVRWDDRPLRWRVPPGFHSPPPSDRLVLLEAVLTILQYPASPRPLRDPLAVLWPALTPSQQDRLATRASRWPPAVRARLQRVRSTADAHCSVHDFPTVGSTK